jgi:ferredoxin
MLNEALQSKGTQLSYTEGIKLPGNYILKFDVPSTEETHKILEEADGIIEEAANAIAKKEIRPLTRSGIYISKIGSRLFYRSAAKFDEKFTVNEKCTSCGLCSEICPVQNIKLVNKKPAWQHHCERCLACIQWCPAEAIQYGKTTAKRGRYHNPNIRAKDIVEGNKGTTNV